MFKYLPALKKTSNYSIISLSKINKHFAISISNKSFFTLHKFNFSSNDATNKTDGRTQKKELSFFERLKEKFSVKESEKIDQSKLQKRDEEEDNQIHSTKLENDVTFTEEEMQNLKQLMEQETEEIEKIETDRVNTNIEIPFSEKTEENLEKGETFEILISKLNLKLFEPNLSVRRQYNNLKYDEVIQPRIGELMKIGFNQSQVKVILQKYQKFLLDESNLSKISQIKNLLLNEKKFLNFSESEALDVLSCIPNSVELSLNKISENLEEIRNFFKLEDAELKTILMEYPILISNKTSDIHKLEFYFNLYLEINKEEFYQLARRFPLLLIATPDNTLNIFRLIDNYNIERKEWREIIKRNPNIFIFKHTQIKNVFSLLSEIGFKAKETFEFVKLYPDLLLANRYNILKKKILLFGDLQMNKATIRNLIKNFPFLLLKSYNSFIDKVFYFSKELNMNIEEIDIYPLIYLYDLKRDIKPRCELMKKMNKWIPFKEAFSMSVEDLAKKLGASSSVDISDSAPLYERDLLFRYSKYFTI